MISPVRQSQPFAISILGRLCSLAAACGISPADSPLMMIIARYLADGWRGKGGGLEFVEGKYIASILYLNPGRLCSVLKDRALSEPCVFEPAPARHHQTSRSAHADGHLQERAEWHDWMEAICQGAIRQTYMHFDICGCGYKSMEGLNTWPSCPRALFP